MTRRALRIRWLGRTAFSDADALQRALHARSSDDHLLLLEHPHLYTLGTRGRIINMLRPPREVGAQLVRTDRGGDITYHGPGQLVGYPIVTLPDERDGLRDVVAYVRRLEAILIRSLDRLGVAAERHPRLTGVWIDDRKVAAIGVKVANGRTRHGFALNVDPDMAMFDHIVPCGIHGKGVTSLAQVMDHPPDMQTVVDAVIAEFVAEFEPESGDRESLVDVQGLVRAPRLSDRTVRLDPPRSRRPDWMRIQAKRDANYETTESVLRSLNLNTVCEEAGCPNIFECWADRTATFMLLGSRCTRACGFCQVDTQKPSPIDPLEPVRVADAVVRLELDHVVITSVARDDLGDGGASVFAETIAAVRAQSPTTQIEVLIPDCKGDRRALDVIFDTRPDVLNHNLETVARLQRTVRPSASYARSLALLARAADAGLVTKSGLILGMGESEREVQGAMADLADVGTRILTLGQYLRPSAAHVPVARWWHPDEFAALREHGDELGFAHVEAGPLVRSSYHAKQASEAARS